MKFPLKRTLFLYSFTVLCLISNINGISVLREKNEFLESDVLENILKSLEPKNFLPVIFKSKEKSVCQKDLEQLFDAIKRSEPWALKMIDASSKIPSGIFAGNVMDLGMYDECIETRGNFSTTENSGRHCIYQLNIILPGNVTLDLKPKLGICLPSTCDVPNIVNLIKIINIMLHIKGIAKDVDIKVEYATCSYLKYEKYSTGFIIFMSFLSLFIIFLLACTVLKLMENWLKSKNYNNKIITNFSRFSLINSSLRILSTKINSGSISTVHGIRALSILWVVYGHELYFNLLTSFVNLVDFMDWTKSWRSFYLSMGIYAVDSFFMLSGFLLSYLFLKRMSQGKKFNVVEFYIHRIIRLTPALGALILITIYIVPHLGSGPRWEGDIVANVSQKCEDAWWKIILYVQNYAGKNTAENMFCLGHLWYLSVDMQLFWLSPFIIYPLAKKPKIGLIILGLALIASIVTPAVIVAKYELLFSVLSLDHLDKMVDTANKYYTKTHCRASPWFIGIFFGYIMANKKSKPRKIIICIGWVTAAVCFILCTWGHIVTLRKEYEYNVVLEAALSSLGHFFWSSGLAWIIYACHHGAGGLINKFLSLPLFVPISKISYSLYLLHYLFQNLKAGSSRLSSYFSDFGILESFLGNLCFCLILSFFFCIIFESPILILEKMIFGEKKKSKEAVTAPIQKEKVPEIRTSFDKGENGFHAHDTIIDPVTNEPTTTL